MDEGWEGNLSAAEAARIKRSVQAVICAPRCSHALTKVLILVELLRQQCVCLSVSLSMCLSLCLPACLHAIIHRPISVDLSAHVSIQKRLPCRAVQTHFKKPESGNFRLFKVF